MEAVIKEIHDPPPTAPADDSSSSREQQPERTAATAAAETISQNSTSRECSAKVNNDNTIVAVLDDFVLLDSATFVPRDGQFLPDIDDAAMSQVQKYMMLYEQDLIWSFVSDGIFLLGGVLYVILSLFDFWTPTSALALQAFDALQVLAPLVYVLNSFVDIRWTGAARRRIKDKRLLINNLEGWRSYRCCDEETIASSSVDSNSTSAAHRASPESSIWSTLNRLRKHAAHRRSTMAAFTFGIAATLGFLAVVTDIDGERYPPQLARILDKWQNYFYILSASICISGKRKSPWMGYMACDNIPWLSNPDTLEDLGDLLFLIGSIIDTVLTEVPLLDADPIAPLLSSLLWMADSCLYLRGDFIIASNQASPVGDDDSLLV